MWSRIKPYLLPLCVFLTLPLSGLLYYATNKSTSSVHNLELGMDHWIPFLKIFILPYMIWYPFVYLSMLFLLFRDRKTYYRFMLVLNLCFVVCFNIYLYYQTTFVRPIVSGTDWLAKIVNLVQQMDEPYNCFPSLHVVTSYLVMKSFYKSSIDSKRIRWVVYVLGSSVIVSTLFVKQHVLMDVAGGIVLVEVMAWLVTVMETLRVKAQLKRSA